MAVFSFKIEQKFYYNECLAGYQLLRDMGHPYASVGTINNWIKDMDMQPGFQEQNFKLLALEAKKWKPQDCIGVLVSDEIHIKASFEVDPSTQSILGMPTIPVNSKPGKKVCPDPPATKAMVFTIVGMATRWKVIAAYHFTANSFCSTTVGYIIKGIIQKAKEDCGVTIVANSMDSAPANMAI